MIQKGIVEEVIDKYNIRVRIPKYHKVATAANGTKTEDLPISLICNQPGTYINYAVNDVVLIGFENTELSKPIILGLLYRDISTDTQIAIPSISSKVTELAAKVEAINLSDLRTYIRYSNDNGKTFTSLFNKETLTLETTSQGMFYTATGIEINKDSKVIYWSIINALNIEITDSFTIETTIHNAPTLEESNKKFTFSNTLISVPADLKNLDALYVSFKMLKICDIDDIHAILTTDKDLLGTTYGGYVGICVSSEATAPVDLAAYSWMSVADTSDAIVGSIKSLYSTRIERIERSLYGFDYSTSNQVSDGTGIKDVLNITDKEINLYSATNKNINFNSTGSVLVDNTSKSYIAEGLSLTNPTAANMFTINYKPNNHMSIIYKGKK